MKNLFFLVPFLVGICLSSASAQVTMDVSKVTCGQFVTGEVANTRFISIWLYGYYNGTRKNTVIDVVAVQEFEQGLIHYCLSNTAMPISEASNNLLGTKK
jgi:acid stress chaperone HdeB